MTRGLALLYRHFGRLGLEMHIGRGTTASKTECIFFPPPGFFDSRLPFLPALNCADEIHDVLDFGNDALTNEEHRAEQQNEHAGNEKKSYMMVWTKPSPYLLKMVMSPSADTSNILAPSFPSACVTSTTSKNVSLPPPNPWEH